MVYFVVPGVLLVLRLCQLSFGEIYNPSLVIINKNHTSTTNGIPENDFIEVKNLCENSVTRTKRDSSMSSDIRDRITRTTKFWWQGSNSPFGGANLEVPISSQPHKSDHTAQPREPDILSQPWNPNQSGHSGLNKPIDFQSNPFLSAALGLKSSSDSRSMPHNEEASNRFGAQNNDASNRFGLQKDGASNKFGAQNDDASNRFGLQKDGESNKFGAQNDDASNRFGLQKDGASNRFGAQNDDASNRFRTSVTTVDTETDNSCGVWKKSYETPTNAEFSWHAILVLTANYATLCSATIIADNAVITTGDCVGRLESKEIVVKAGKGIISTQNHHKSVQVRNVIVIARHQCNEVAREKDLAILIIENPFIFNDYVDKICIPSNSYPWYQPTDRKCIVTGWAHVVLPGWGMQNVLHKARVNYIPTDQCKTLLKQTEDGSYFEPRINDGFTCATRSSDDALDLCKIQNGGSLICARDDGHYELAGVKRWDLVCKQDVPTVITTCISTWTHATLAKSITILIEEEKKDIYELSHPTKLNGFLVAKKLTKLIKKE